MTLTPSIVKLLQIMGEFVRSKTKCPVCGFNIPVWIHISFNNNAGLDCPSCHSLLGHSHGSLTPKWILLLTFVVSISRLIDGHINLLWIGLCVVSIVLLFYIQLTIKFVVKYENKTNQ